MEQRGEREDVLIPGFPKELELEEKEVVVVDQNRVQAAVLVEVEVEQSLQVLGQAVVAVGVV